MSDTVLILTECGADVGFGHLTRCLSLGQAFQEAGRNVQIWAAADDLAVDGLPVPVRPLTWYGLPGKLAAEAGCVHGIVLDSFKVGVEQLQRIIGINRHFAVIDDFPRRPYKNGVVIDWTVGAVNSASLQRCPGVLYLLGGQYCALRPEFRHAGARDFADSPRSLLLTFGGADVRHLTAPVLAMLQSKFPALEKRVVFGPANRNISFGSFQDDNTSVHVAVDGRHMQALMAGADLGVCGGGQTLYEFASQGLPTILVHIADDQEDDIHGFIEAGFGVDAGAWHDPKLLDALASGIDGLWGADTRARHSAIGQQLVDGQGADRVVTALLAEWGDTANV